MYCHESTQVDRRARPNAARRLKPPRTKAGLPFLRNAGPAEVDPPEKDAGEFKLSAMGVLSTLHQTTH
jgi:hypothetical protein